MAQSGFATAFKSQRWLVAISSHSLACLNQWACTHLSPAMLETVSILLDSDQCSQLLEGLEQARQGEVVGLSQAFELEERL